MIGRAACHGLRSQALVVLRVDLIAVIGAVTFWAARRATADIPIVFTIVLDPVASGMITDVDRPGGNITGACITENRQPRQSREHLLQHPDLVPRLAGIEIRHVPDTLPNLNKAAAEAEGLRPQVVLLRDAHDLDRAFTTFRNAGADALLSLEVPRTSTFGGRIAELAVAARLPTMFGRDLARYGPMLAYGTSLAAAAHGVDGGPNSQRGEARRPAGRARRAARVVVNLEVARKVGVTIPPDVLARADQVAE